VKTKHTHIWKIQGSVIEDGRRCFTLVCSTCGKTKSQSRKLPSSKSRTSWDTTASTLKTEALRMKDVEWTHGDPGFKIKRKAIPRQSEKRKVLDKEYSKLRKAFLTENPKCAVFPDLPSDQVHHRKSRGKYLNDVSTWSAVSAEGHRWIHDNPKAAKERGLLELHT
jgi:hypothetical protein